MLDARLGDLLAPLRRAPETSAVLLDVDGTLAPITTQASDTTVPPATREALAAVVGSYALVACITGRRTAAAREIVGVEGLHYVGNHGSEILRQGATEPEVRPEIAAWESRVRELAEDLLADARNGADPAARGVRLEDKGPIQAYHWRGAEDEDACEALAEALGARARDAGLVLHRGRMVLELRPPVPFDKGAAVRWLLDGRDPGPALYAGDDRTDLDAFAGLRGLRDAGALTHAACVAVADTGTPPEVAASADVTVAGTDGVRAMLEGLRLP